MGSIKRRLDKLEGDGGKPCEVCGIDHSLPPTFHFGGKLEWGEKLPPDEYCRECGQPVRSYFTLDLGARANPWPKEEDAQGWE